MLLNVNYPLFIVEASELQKVTACHDYKTFTAHRRKSHGSARRGGGGL